MLSQAPPRDTGHLGLSLAENSKWSQPGRSPRPGWWTLKVLARGWCRARGLFALLGMVRLVAELHAGGHDVPDFALIRASGIARCGVLGVVVERKVVVGHLLRAVSAVDRAKGARGSRRQHRAVRGRDLC